MRQLDELAEPVLLHAEVPATEASEFDASQPRFTYVRAGPGAVFVLAPTFPAEGQVGEAELTVVGLQ